MDKTEISGSWDIDTLEMTARHIGNPCFIDVDSDIADLTYQTG